MALAVTHSKILVAPDTGAEDKVYGSDYVSLTSHTLAGVASLAQGGTNNATGTATVNADLTGPVTSAGNATAIANSALAIAKIAATATDKVFGRSTAGAGDGEEIACTAAGRALLDDATAADQKTTLGGIGYTVFSSPGAVLNPADATTYYQGLGGVAITTAAILRVYFPVAGTLTDLYLNVGVGGTLGDAATGTAYFRLNNTTDTTISAAVSFTAAAQSYALTGQSIAIAAGDYFQIKLLCPTWATTNPTSVVLTFTGFVRT